LHNELGRNDICYCGSNKKYKDCHLKPFYPNEYFNAEIKEFDSIKFENRAAPHISIGRVDVFYRDRHPWDNEISNLLQPLTKIKWNESDMWENRVRKRINKLVHKLSALQFHTNLFKSFEKNTETNYTKYLAANTTMNKIYDDPHLIFNVESFLFQSKSCLDVFAQMIAYIFKFKISTYGRDGDDLIKILKQEPSKNHPEHAKQVIEIIQKNRIWVKELIDMRDEVTHYSDLEGLSCFLIKMSGENDKVATIYYPAMTSGERVSKYMDKTWSNICHLIRECTYPLVNAAKKL
jgi:hypothetical protein